MEKLKELPSYFENGLLKNEEWELGVDEAGRGPVLGPMVYACCYWPVKLKKDIAKLGFTDSKKLKEEERDQFFEQMKELNEKYLGFQAKVLDPEYISNKMFEKKKISLNKISHDSAIELIETALSKGINIVHCYLDTVGIAATYTNILKAHFKPTHPKIKFTVSEKADSKYPIVGAASICAKVTRDAALRSWKFREKLSEDMSLEYGSGYPSDEKTTEWLSKCIDPVFGFPDFVRFSWKTTTELIEKHITIDFGDKKDKDEKQQTLYDFVVGEKRGYYLTNIGMTNKFDV